MMLWEEVRERFPNEWVVLEATKAHSEEGYRYIEELIVMGCFRSSVDAMNRYYELYREQPQREFCFFHTDRENLISQERYRLKRGIITLRYISGKCGIMVLKELVICLNQNIQ